MATLVCDVCSGVLVMNSGGESATCSVCGISYSVERLREKASEQNIITDVTVNVVNKVTPETLEELQALGQKYIKLGDWEGAEKIYSKILDKAPTDEAAFDILNKLKIWKHMIVENGVLKKFTGKVGEVCFPETVTSIGSKVFSGGKGVHTVVFNEKIENIERDAFYQSRDLKRVLGLSAVKFIGKGAFYECNALEECELGDNIEYISDEAFKGCSSLKSIKLPKTLKQLERASFKGCSSLEEIVLPENIAVVSASLFEQCVNLKSVKLPDGVTKIEANAFYGCKAMNEIELPSALEELQVACFKETGLITLNIPEKICELPVQCFDRCESISQIALPATVKKLGDKAFYGCTALTSIVFDPNITVGRQTFFNCRKLMYVNLPKGEETTTSVALVDLSSPLGKGGMILSPELFAAFKGTPYYNSEILRRRSNKLCERCAGKCGFFGKCKVCGYKPAKDKRRF